MSRPAHHGTMPYCPLHERAWTRPNASGWPQTRYAGHWAPLSRYILAYAQAYAAAFDCTSQIRPVATPCDLCHKENAP